MPPATLSPRPQVSPVDPTTPSSQPATTRLYISPLDPGRLAIILPASYTHLAAGFSYHTIETFPEKSYGYLELPADEALRLRRKLHGSVLKGAKMRVEEARSEKRKAGEDGDATADQAKADKAERRSKRKRSARTDEDGILNGVELPDGRKVKRGWTDGAAKANKDNKDGAKARSKGGHDAQLVFRASLPPNVASKTPEGEAAASKSKNKKSKRGGKNGAESDVTEFEKTTKYPSFLRDSSSGSTTKKTKEFVDGKGWVDEDGNLVEAAKDSRMSSVAPMPSVEAQNDQTTTAENNESSAEDSDSESSGEDITSEDDDKEHTPRPVDLPSQNMTPEITTTAPEDEIKHPSVLETLFKRPAASASSNTRKTKPAPVNTGFGFSLDNDLAEADDASPTTEAGGMKRKKPGALMIPPQTPFTRRDLDARGMRSAAPTPDTAALGRRSRPPWSSRDSRSLSTGRETPDSVLSNGQPDFTNGAEAEYVVDTQEGAEMQAVDGTDTTTGDGEQTEFEKQFYEQRGAYNRSWRTGKRMARKEARQTENRKGLRSKG